MRIENFIHQQKIGILLAFLDAKSSYDSTPQLIGRCLPKCVNYSQQSAAATGRDRLPPPKASWKVSPNGSPRVELDNVQHI